MRVQIAMRTSLRVLFKTLGPVLDVTVHKNLRLRGQAFVAFEKAETAEKAVKEVNKFPLYGKPMVSSALFFVIFYAPHPPLILCGTFSKSRMPRHRQRQ
jgi:RNA recognition motif-containing protein